MTTSLVPSKELTRDQVCQSLQGHQSQLCEQANLITSFYFQQAINCCGFTSIAYALTAMGCETTVDDIFRVVGADVESAVGDGMTLAEIHDATLRYIHRKDLPIFAECYHFDTHKASVDGFKQACLTEAQAGIDDIVILNFHSGIAHGWESGGGGHFSVLTAYNKDTDEIIMADVHGMKYGTYWSTPVGQMYEAMRNRDSCGRARGAIRFGKKNKGLTKPLHGLEPTLVDWTDPPRGYDRGKLAGYIPEKWDEGLGVKNMEGCSALAAAMRILEGDEARISRLDEIMRALGESYTFHLNTFLPAGKLVDMADGLRERGLSDVRAAVVRLESRDWEGLKKGLVKAECGAEGVVVMVRYDVNVAYGAELVTGEKGEAAALSHGTKSWSLVAGFDVEAGPDEAQGVVIAAAHNVILTGRLWTSSLRRLAKAMCEVEHAPTCSLVVLRKQ